MTKITGMLILDQGYFMSSRTSRFGPVRRMAIQRAGCKFGGGESDARICFYRTTGAVIVLDRQKSPTAPTTTRL